MKYDKIHHNMSEETIKILVVEADKSICEIIKLGSIDQGWEVDETRDGIAAIKLLRRNAYQAIILSLDLPVIDGRMVMGLAQESVRCPVIFIGKSGAEEDRLAAFEAGGNDYIQKPFFPRELFARLRNLMKLFDINSKKQDILAAGPVRIERYSKNSYIYDRRLKLTRREYNLLLLLCGNPGHTFSRNSLLNSAWGESFEGGDRTVDAHIKSLRKKIHPYEDCIQTIWGYGYRFEA